MRTVSQVNFEKIREYITSHRLEWSFFPTLVRNNDTIDGGWYTRNNSSPMYFVIGNRQALQLALMFDVLDGDKKTEDWRAIILSPEWLKTHPQLEKLYLRAGGAKCCKMDVRDADCPITMHSVIGKHGFHSTRLSYSGELSERMARSYAKTMFVNTVSSYWSGDFIIGRGDHRISKKLNGLAKSKVLANAILLGEHEIDIPVGGRGARLTGFKAEALLNTTFNLETLDEKTRHYMESVQTFRDYAELWHQAIEDNRFFAMCVSEKDLEDSPDEVIEAFKKGAEFVNLNSYLDAYRAGVPVSDIVSR